MRIAGVGGFFEGRVGGGGFCDGGGVGGVAEERMISGEENNSGSAGLTLRGTVMTTRRCISSDAQGLFSGWRVGMSLADVVGRSSCAIVEDPA